MTAPSPKSPILHATIEYKYDNNGNQIEMKVTKGKGKGNVKITTYEYDYENRLTNIIHPDGMVSRYVYDGVGKRIKAI